MSYKLTEENANKVLQKLMEEYQIYAPKRFKKQGRYSDTDIVKYDVIQSLDDIVFDEKSDFPAKEVLSPITQAVMYFTEDEFRASKESTRPILLFMRPCDIHAMKHQEKILLTNGNIADMYYSRMKDRVKVVMMECREGFDTCFCVSMGTNKADEYAMAVRKTDDGLSVELHDNSLLPYFDGAPGCDFAPEFVQKNELEVTVPEIKDKETLVKLKQHPFWNQYNGRCISCGACTVACSTCTCFSTTDIAYGSNGNVGERRRTTSSCQVAGFDKIAGNVTFRKDAASRMRYKVMHKFHDYKERFGDFHMCVGCGRCTDRCPEFISITHTLSLMKDALEEIEG